jgi:hypothetical protein
MLGACAGVRPEASASSTAGTVGGEPTGGAGGIAGAGGPSGRGGTGLIVIPDAGTGTDARAPRCDDAGACACMNVGSLGKVAHYGGNSDSTDAFQQYLNTKSNARVTLLTERTTLTPELLASYDVLILQALEDSEYIGFWSYTQAEIDAVADWVRAGNGLIALTGYGGNPDEVTASNQLLAFAGIAYGKSDTFVSCPDNYCYCTDSSVPFARWSAGGFAGVHMQAPSGAVGAVGVFHGRPLTCVDNGDGPCEVVASDPQAGIVGVGKHVGTGRVFVWSDEWVTYTSQWGATNTHGADCNGHTAGEIYDVPQFWFNVIHWVLPDARCFHIADPIIVE